MPDALHGAGSGTAPALTDLHARSSWRSAATIALEYCLIALAVVVGGVLHAAWTQFLIVLFIGTRQYALGECMAHEASHRNLSSRTWLNEALGVGVCWPFFFTLAGYRRFHNRLHHKISLTNNANSIYEDYEDWGLPADGIPLGRWEAYWLLVIRPLMGFIGLRHLVKTAEDFYWDGDLAENTAMLLCWAVIVVAAACGGCLVGLLMYWVIPWAVVVPILNYWSEVGDHYRVAGAETRSNLSWFLNRLIAHNIGFHALHHRYPSIPWFRLPRAYPIFRHELLEQVSKGHAATFRQIIAQERSLRSATISQPSMGLLRRLTTEEHV